ncbi:MAG TPA: ABC transporter ATP-binding protein [Candidatus Cloacimonadota bacterium]|mgnify:CR=1 FL=1|nr:ABC transporter ATP-binding protein [Candidatus Cloacimonadota bacterium]HPT73240.1 ABC transporter ATP-binding protein [Candidatus Cloacimonadota bacterium]
MITIKNLSKSYGDVKALNEVNLHFDTGNIYGVVGPNGAGKTTLFNCIAGLIPYVGEIYYEVGDLRNHMGFLQTEPYFMSLITGREYLQLLCNARNIPFKGIEEANIFDLPLNRFASTYSTGMKKKLALTGVLIQKNDVFILDEPFNGVDIESNLLITEIIKTLKSMHKTMIISSHILSSLTDICDYFIVLKEGKVDRHVDKKAYPEIENEMRSAEIGEKMERVKKLV